MLNNDTSTLYDHGKRLCRRLYPSLISCASLDQHMNSVQKLGVTLNKAARICENEEDLKIHAKINANLGSGTKVGGVAFKKLLKLRTI